VQSLTQTIFQPRASLFYSSVVLSHLYGILASNTMPCEVYLHSTPRVCFGIRNPRKSTSIVPQPERCQIFYCIPKCGTLFLQGYKLRYTPDCVKEVCRLRHNRRDGPSGTERCALLVRTMVPSYVLWTSECALYICRCPAPIRPRKFAVCSEYIQMYTPIHSPL
jgi:hypothetical protein